MKLLTDTRAKELKAQGYTLKPASLHSTDHKHCYMILLTEKLKRPYLITNDRQPCNNLT